MLELRKRVKRGNNPLIGIMESSGSRQPANEPTTSVIAFGKRSGEMSCEIICDREGAKELIRALASTQVAFTQELLGYNPNEKLIRAQLMASFLREVADEVYKLP